MYTLSDGTRNIIGKVNQTIKLKLYYSRVAAMKGPEQIRFYNNYYLYVRDLLEEYAALSGGRLELSVIDPRSFSDEEEEAIRHGVKRFPISEDENFFFGLVAQTELGKEKAIEFFEPDRQEFVEYDISKLITDVTRRAQKKIGVLSSLPVIGADMTPYMMQMLQMQGRTPPKPWNIISHLREAYEVVSVDKEAAAIEEDVDFLMVIHPKDLKEKTLFAIDQFVMKGGKLLVFVDPHCMVDEPKQDQRNPYARFQHKADSNLNALLKRWGVEMDPKLIAADRNLAIKARLQNRAAPLMTYLALGEACVNPEEVITARLHSVRMLFAGALAKVPDAETTVTPLLSTTKTGNTWEPKGSFELQMPDPEAISRAVPDGTLPVMLACRISGKLKTNFPDGIEPEDDAEAGEAGEKGDEEKEAVEEKEAEPETEVIKEASPDAAVLVFADVDMITDGLAYQRSFFGVAQVGENASVVLNALEFLSGTGDLITIRSRGRFERPFLVIDKIETEAERATAEETEAINVKIRSFEEKLRKLGAAATEENADLIRSTAITGRRKIQADIRKARKELRALNTGKRKKIEALKASLQTHNMVWAPTAVLLVAIVLAVVRLIRAKRYAARRT
ncbi:MAG: GldG family protein [Planctomycetes bacterium]|nr:GldG family protein [Planctomycetota bacterium]